MNGKYSKIPYILAVIFGFISPFTSDIGPFLIAPTLFFLFTGSLLGFFWPNESWRWGLWIVGPIFILTALSVLFAGQLDIFLKKDMPILLLGITSACLGSFILARYKLSRSGKAESEIKTRK